MNYLFTVKNKLVKQGKGVKRMYKTTVKFTNAELQMIEKALILLMSRYFETAKENDKDFNFVNAENLHYKVMESIKR